MTIKKCKGRPEMTNRNKLVCKLRLEDNMSLKDIAEMFKTTESNISHIVERHFKNYLWKIKI